MINTMDRVYEHYNEALNYFPSERIIVCALHGSQNYGLATEKSDVDTKVLATPSFEEIALNNQPWSHTHIRPNNEHIDFKDIRLYIGTFYKQNLNFLEILFTDYIIVNSLYEDIWVQLVEKREEIARLNPYRELQSLQGIANNKYRLITTDNPSTHDNIINYGYDPKNLYQLVRIETFIKKFINDIPYAECLDASEQRSYLLEIKSGIYPINEALKLRQETMNNINEMCENFKINFEAKDNQVIINFLQNIQKEFIYRGLQLDDIYHRR